MELPEIMKKGVPDTLKSIGILLVVVCLVTAITWTMTIMESGRPWNSIAQDAALIAFFAALLLLVLAVLFKIARTLFGNSSAMLSSPGASSTPVVDHTAPAGASLKGAKASGVAFLACYGLVVLVLYSVAEHPKTFSAGSGLQAQDTDFRVSRCKGYDEFPKPPPAPGASRSQIDEERKSEAEDKANVFRKGLQSVTWEDSGRLHIVYGVVTNCAAPFDYGGYRVSGDKLTLEYSILWETIKRPDGSLARMRTACGCGYELSYRIAGLERKNYSIEIDEVEKH